MKKTDKSSLITHAAVREVLREYWLQYRSQPFSTITSFLAPAIGTILVFFVPPLVIAELVNRLASGENVSLGSVWVYIALFGGLWMFGEVLWRLGQHFWIKIEAQGMNNLSRLAFERLVKRDYDFFVNSFVGTLTKNISSFTRGFETVTDILVYNIFSNVFSLVFATVILWHYSPWIPAILLMWMVFGISVGIPLIRRRAKLIAERHEAASKMVGRLSDAITNIFAVKSFAKESQEEQRFGEHVDDYSVKWRRAGDYQNLKFYSVMSPIYVASNLTGLIASIYFISQFNLQAGVMVIIFSYYQQITRIFWEVNHVYRNLESAVSEASEFTQMLLEPPKVEDAVGAPDLRSEDNSVEFKNVGFGYTGLGGLSHLFLENFNLKINENQRVGLVGPSGGGKTTITKLLLRFLDVQSGGITIGDQDISQVTQKSLREVVSYVPQEPLLFHRSLFENIAYGKDGATEEEVVRAAKLARADEFISVLPEGYQTLVGERGVKLSGGQRQRIAIARAILKNSPILVLDEATSSLDSESEKHIQEGLWELMKDKTALVIAHRLSTIKHLDRIIVLQGGKIVQDGTHDELIKTPGLYATLWSHQSGAFLADEPLENGRDHSGGSNYSDFRLEHST